MVRLRKAVAFAANVKTITRDEEARAIWRKVYPELSEGRPGLLGAMTSRAERASKLWGSSLNWGTMGHPSTVSRQKGGPLPCQVPRVMGADEARAGHVQEVAVLAPPSQQLEPRGLTLAEATARLPALQPCLLAPQATALGAPRWPCDHGGKALDCQACHPRTCRTRLGPPTWTRPRWSQCRGRRRKTMPCRPLSALLPEATAPALRWMDTPWAALVS